MRLIPPTRATFGKDLHRRLNLLKNLTTQLIQREQIITTRGKAKAVRPILDMLIQHAKKNTPQLRQEVELQF